MPSPGKLSIQEYLKRQNNEDPQVQAKRIFDQLLLDLEKDPTKKIGLIYAANNHQAQQFHQAYQKKTKPEQLPVISGSGQATVFYYLNQLINEENKKGTQFSDRIRVLPVATSLFGGENGPGNIVDAEMIDRDLKAIQDHLLDGYDVQGIPNTSNQFAIGGLASKYWFTQNYCGVELDNKSMSQGVFVQKQLEKLVENPSAALDPAKLNQGLHYEFATTGKGRDHGEYTATSALPGLKGLKGDALKTKILEEFRSQIAGKSASEIIKIYDKFKSSEEYTILKTGQGWATRLFRLKTDSMRALDSIIEESQPKPPK
jgi:hypothetical protein